MRALLVNPWIADVAAYNLWLRPLGLYALGEWLWARGAEVALVDALSPAPAPGKFPRTPVPPPLPLDTPQRRFARYGIPPEVLRERLRGALEASGGADVVFLTSAMSYWYPGVQWTIEEIRRLLPHASILLGGVYATLWPGHAARHGGADRVFPGPLERISDSLADHLGLPRRPPREPLPWYRLGLHDGQPYAGLRTARGCPFRCTYCGATLLAGGFAPREPAAIEEELRALHDLGVRDVAFYDDALLLDFEDRLAPMLERVSGWGPDLRLHAPNGIHARLVTDAVARSLVRAGCRTVRLGLETVDRDRQRDTGGKVRSGEVEAAVGRLLRAGLAPADIGVYLLFGLPGQSLDEVRESVTFVRSLGVRPHLCEFSPIPGTPAWDQLLRSGTIPPGLDPLYTNNTLFTRLFSSHPAEGLEALLRDCRSP